MSWGYHLILDCGSCSNNIKDKNTIELFSKTLVEEIKMVPYGEPIIEYFGTGTIENSGYTLIQLIETSNITAHFVDYDNSAYIDVFSCKEFDEQTVVELVYKFFKPKNIITKNITRQAKSG